MPFSRLLRFGPPIRPRAMAPAGLLVLLLATPAFAAAPEEPVFWLWEFIGRFHPLVVHFPIGLLVAAFLFELTTLGGKRAGLHEGIRWMVYLGAGTAVLAAGAGWLLASTGGYGGSALTVHQWSGLTTAGLALLTAALLHRAEQRPGPRGRTPYRIAFASCLLGVTVAGHLGAGLTHGGDYLTSALPWNLPPESRAGEVLAELRAVRTDAPEASQLDRLNLEVRAVFAHKCYKCHSTEKHEGELVLDTREGVMQGGESGPILVAGASGRSEIVRRLTLPRGHEEAMPQKARALDPAEIDLIKLWIDLGAHWADAELKVFPEAPLALHRPALPPGQGHPVDRLVDAYFERHDLRRPDPVDDRRFIRRAYLDAVGLLPAPEDVEAFVADTNPEKRERLVERLLADEHGYAQHWLTFWNDLLRNDYSGTGFITGGRKQITEWLYDALVANAPYDTLVHELLSPGEASEGFIRGIQWRGVTNNSQRVEMQAAQNVSQALLGLNLKCASCHDSFVSNLKLDQAYGFASVFADTVLDVFRCDQPTGRVAEAAFLYPELGTISPGGTVEARLARLSDLVVQPANGRLYRTITNRIWDRLLGRGFVMPVDEMDQAPWSPEVLDWLAADFLDHGTDLKHLITRIMTSRAYQLPAVPAESAQELLGAGYRFEGPVRRRMSAEQFADALSRLLGPVYPGVAFDPLAEPMEAEWIWFPERAVDRDVLPLPGRRYFRHTFTLPAGRLPESAEALVTADHAFTLYVNGARTASGADWRRVQRLDLTDRLRPGRNVLAVEGENDGRLPNPAGLLFSLQLTFPGGAQERVFSNTSWKTTDEQPEAGWTEAGFDDGGWAEARRYGGFDGSTWGRLLDFRHGAATPRLPFARASLVRLDPFLKALGRPTRENVTTRRDDQATLLQALELTNGDFFNNAVREGAEAWRRRYAADAAGLVTDFYRHALGRRPDEREQKAALAVLGERPDREAVEDLVWAVLMLPEFQLID